MRKIGVMCVCDICGSNYFIPLSKIYIFDVTPPV